LTNWVNEKLGERDKKLKIGKEKLAKGAFSDGVLFATLYEITSGLSLSGINAKPKTREEKLKNVNIFLDALRKRVYVEATADSLVDSNELKTLDTLWRVFTIFQLKRPGLKPAEGAAEMIRWLSGSGFDVTDLTKSWHSNSMLLITLVNTIRQDLIPMKAVTKDATKNAEKAIEVAEEHLAIPALIEGCDFISEEPDYISNFIYLSYFKANHPTLKSFVGSASNLSENSATTHSESTKKNDSDEEKEKAAASKKQRTADDAEHVSSKEEVKPEKTMGKNAPRSKSAPRLNTIKSGSNERPQPSASGSSSASSSPKKKRPAPKPEEEQESNDRKERRKSNDKAPSKSESSEKASAEGQSTTTKESKSKHGDKVAKTSEVEKVAKNAEGDKVAKNSEGDKVAKKAEGEKVAKNLEGDKVAKKSEGEKLAKNADAKKSEGEKAAKKSEGEKVAKTPESDVPIKTTASTESLRELSRTQSKSASGSSGSLITPRTSNNIFTKIREKMETAEKLKQAEGHASPEKEQNAVQEPLPVNTVVPSKPKETSHSNGKETDKAEGEKQTKETKERKSKSEKRRSTEV
jgi:hypothetical protein